MKASVDDNCTACGLCVDTCPEVFEMDDDIAVVKVEDVSTDLEETCCEAADNCPVDAIHVDEE